jgi:hypothetical protein
MTAENETTSTQPFVAQTGFSATYDADNRLASYNGTPINFDSDGNMLTGPAPGTLASTDYSYNARNQVIEDLTYLLDDLSCLGSAHEPEKTR